MTWCTYITVHEPTGKFYVGKSHTDKVFGGYKGGGVLLANNFKKYPKEEWKTGVLWEFDTDDEALSDEGGIVTQELLDDPLCLNLMLGGYGCAGAAMSAAATLRNNDPVVKAKNIASNIGKNKGKPSKNKGVPASEASKLKNRNSHLGKTPWNKGNVKGVKQHA